MGPGSMATILQDNIYLPSDFVERTLAFHRDKPLSLLSYPEARFAAPPGLVLPSALRSGNPSSHTEAYALRIVIDSRSLPTPSPLEQGCFGAVSFQ